MRVLLFISFGSGKVLRIYNFLLVAFVLKPHLLAGWLARSLTCLRPLVYTSTSSRIAAACSPESDLGLPHFLLGECDKSHSLRTREQVCASASGQYLLNCASHFCVLCAHGRLLPFACSRPKVSSQVAAMLADATDLTIDTQAGRLEAKI